MAVISKTARQDLLDIWLHISEHSINAADDVIDELHKLAAVLDTYPELGKARPELAPEIRSMPAKYPYTLYYRAASKTEIEVARVLHQSRDIASLDFNA